ncbi:MAG: hypothetical protein LUE27_06490 [Clostridia bacterium]|nr:hypothetical protein [Clostridia bacterium]
MYNKKLEDDFLKERSLVEKRMQIKDWEHLLKYAPPNPIRGYYRKKIEELKAKEQEPGTE